MILLVTATTLSGIISTYKLKKRVVVAGDLITVCEFCLIEMRYSVPTQQELFRILENCDCIRDLNFFEENGRIFISSYFADDEEKEMINQFQETLGTTDIQGQLSFLEYFKSKSVKLLSEKEEKYKKFSKLYIAFGALGGCAAALMLL